MSDSDSASASSSDSEDLTTTGLIATRAKRATAGNLYAGLIANLDDEEIQKDLLAEDAEDVGDYEGEGEDDDEEDAFESSSDDEDQSPPKEGEEEDLEGEKALKRQERAEARKKRSRQDARLKGPGGLLGRARKRVRLAEGVKEGDGSETALSTPAAPPKPKKKSERSNWLPAAEDGPVRQSGRRLAMENRALVHANLEQSFARSQKQQHVMKAAAERERSKRSRQAELTQEERLRRCERVERETGKELGRFEEEERERQRVREEQLAAKRRRGWEGPRVRVWSGSVVWEGEKVRVARVEHGSLREEELKEIGKKKVVEVEKEAEAGAKEVETGGKDGEEAVGGALDVAGQEAQPGADTVPSNADANQGATVEGSVPWLPGIEQYAAQPAATSAVTSEAPVNGFTPSAPATITHAGPMQYQAPAAQSSQQPTIYHGFPPGSQSFDLPQPVAPHSATVVPGQSLAPPSAPLPAPAPPLIREQAQRTLLMLEDFPELAAAPEPTRPTKRKSLSAITSTTTATTGPTKSDPLAELTPNAIQTILLPSSYPDPTLLTPAQQTYLLTKPRRKGPETTMPLAPPKARCALTQWEAKFRDPKTGVVYADLHAFKALQRALSGGCAWSGVLGCWVGSSLGVGRGVVGEGGKVVGMGRAAKGVPGGFVGEEVVKGEGTG